MDLILYRAEGGVARITLNRPEKRNALNAEVIAGLGTGENIVGLNVT